MELLNPGTRRQLSTALELVDTAERMARAALANEAESQPSLWIFAVNRIFRVRVDLEHLLETRANANGRLEGAGTCVDLLETAQDVLRGIDDGAVADHWAQLWVDLGDALKSTRAALA